MEWAFHMRLRGQVKEGRKGQGDAIGIILVGSGFVLGEGVVSIVGLVLRTAGVPQSCVWCLEGGLLVLITIKFHVNNPPLLYSTLHA